MNMTKSPPEDGLSVRPHIHVRGTHYVKDYVDRINWLHPTFKVCAYIYIALIACLAWLVLPLPGHWSKNHQSDKLPIAFQNIANYFETFNGFSDCRINASELYATSLAYEGGSHDRGTFCPNRKSLLQAMSNGGRVGFDAPYITRGCQYRWYSIAEICMILERFEGLVFIGDDILQYIYNGFNILLRQDLTHGALQTWKMNNGDLLGCKCGNQYTNPSCAQYFLTTSQQVTKNAGTVEQANRRNYFCQRVPHLFLKTGAGKPAQSIVEEFNQAVPRAPRSNYKAIPIIHSLSPAIASHNDAAASLLGVLNLADTSQRKTPMLWIGPTAAGHIEIKGRKTNQEIWDFDNAVGNAAVENGIEVLKMWNLTVQATSWDGMRFGERVSLVQAMMVINWLSRLESS